VTGTERGLGEEQCVALIGCEGGNWSADRVWLDKKLGWNGRTMAKLSIAYVAYISDTASAPAFPTKILHLIFPHKLQVTFISFFFILITPACTNCKAPYYTILPTFSVTFSFVRHHNDSLKILINNTAQGPKQC
jgi:hypothetical protein